MWSLLTVVVFARPPDEPGPTLALSLPKTQVQLGEPLEVELVLTAGREPWSTGVGGGGVTVHATDSTGHAAPVHARSELRGPMDEPVGVPVMLGRRDTVTLRLDLAEFLWIGPGSWTIEVRSDTAAAVTAPTPLVVLPVSADEAAERVERVFVEIDPYAGRPTVGRVAHPVFVPLLEQRVTGVLGRYEQPSTVDRLAIEGIGACPCVEAGEALLRLWDAHPSPPVRDLVQRQLALRWSRRTIDGRPLVAGQGWTEGLGDALLERARALLARPPTGDWTADWSFAADVLEAMGHVADGPLLDAATERALTEPIEGPNAATRRIRTAGRLAYARTRTGAPATPTTHEAMALLHRLEAWDGRTGDPPPGFEAALVAGLGHPSPVLVHAAASRLPPTASDALVAAVVPHLGSDERLTDARVRQWLARDPGGPAREALLVDLDAADGARVADLLSALVHVLPPDELVDLVLARLDAAAPDPEVVWLLSGAIDFTACGEWGWRSDDPGDPAVIAKAWRHELARAGSTLHEQRLAWNPGSSDRRLLPPSFTCGPTPPE